MSDYIQWCNLCNKNTLHNSGGCVHAHMVKAFNVSSAGSHDASQTPCSVCGRVEYSDNPDNVFCHRCGRKVQR